MSLERCAPKTRSLEGTRIRRYDVEKIFQPPQHSAVRVTAHSSRANNKKKFKLAEKTTLISNISHCDFTSNLAAPVYL